MDNFNKSTNQKVQELPEGYLRVKFLRPYPGFSYRENEVGILKKEKAQELIAIVEECKPSEKVKPEPVIEILPDTWVPPVIKEVVTTDDDLIEVKFISFHPGYSYNPGELGKVLKTNYQKLLEDGFIEPVKPKSKFKVFFR